MSSIIKGLTTDEAVNDNPNINVPGFGTVPLDMLKRHVKELSKDFNVLIQQGAFLKAAYYSEQLFNALFAIARAEKEMEKNRTINEREPQSAGGMGQSYHKFVAKPAGLEEDQAPMFTPETTQVDEETPDLKSRALKVMYDAIMFPLRNTPVFPTNEEEFLRIASIKIQEMFRKRYPNLTKQQVAPKSQEMAKDMLYLFFKQEIEPQTDYGTKNYAMRESSILKGIELTQ